MTFRFDKLTTKAQGLVAEAQGRAAEAGNPEISSLHLLAAMLDESEGITGPLLEKMNVDIAQLKEREMTQSEAEQACRSVSGRAPARHCTGVAGRHSKRSRDDAAESLKDEYISTEHLLLGLATCRKPRHADLAVKLCWGSMRGRCSSKRCQRGAR